jgi:phage gpG-like protein
MALTGNFSGMQRLEENLRKLAEIPSRAAVEASVEITKELKREFASGKDPYGRAWAPLKPSTIKSGRRAPPLTDTGTLRDGTEAKPLRGAGIAVTVGAPYGVYHQAGTRKMAPRKILPELVMPASWNRAIVNAVRKAFKKVVKG